ncbi:phage tail sheath family protein [Paraburkholderia aspalathi]|uniref:phage tail sheath family protein n=1 Tax=Paraburkholderia aspalathi TaxID=1324617 RepID=UPI0038BC7944
MSEVQAVPGVYVQESSALSMGVHQGETAVPVFIGHFNRRGASTALDCTRVASWVAFDALFDSSDTLTIDLGKQQEPGHQFTHVAATGSYSVRLYFENGGGPCYVLPVTTGRTLPGLAGAQAPEELAALPGVIAQYPDITLLCWCEHVDADTETKVQTALSSLLKPGAQGNRGYFLLADAAPGDASGGFKVVVPAGLDVPEQTAVYFPSVRTPYQYRPGDAQITVKALSPEVWGGASVSSLAAMKKLAGDELSRAQQVLDGLLAKPDPEPHELDEARASVAVAQEKVLMTGFLDDTGKEWLDLKAVPVDVRASCAMAGVIARTDRERGVWKAPANVALNGVSALVAHDPATGAWVPWRVDDDMNRVLVGAGVNAIREFRGQGVLAWGARTMVHENQPAWRYIPVRRLFNAVERDMGAALRVALFEPNSAPTWERVRAALAIYLDGLWRQGALMGETPEQAYFVHIGLGLTMTQADISEGRMKVKVGMAAVRPAEFIILELTQQVEPG